MLTIGIIRPGSASRQRTVLIRRISYKETKLTMKRWQMLHLQSVTGKTHMLTKIKNARKKSFREMS